MKNTISRFDFLRPLTPDEYASLKADIKQNGQRIPMVYDEDGVLLDGHHRECVLRELGIPEAQWNKQTIALTDDDARFAFVLSANIHRRQSTIEDRKRIAEHFHGLGWTQAQIAKVLGVSQASISGDLSNLSTVDKLKPAKTATNPKGAGRPKGAKSREERSPKAVEREEKIAVLKDAGLSTKEISAKVGLGERAVAQALEHVAIKREAIPKIDPTTLSMTAQQKLAAAIRQEKLRLASEFHRTVQDEISKRIKKITDEILLPKWKAQIEQAQTLFERRYGAMDKATFNAIRRGLHPDSRHAISDAKLGEAFDKFMALEKYLLAEKDSPTEWPTLPKSAAEWEALKAKVKAERKAERAKRQSNVNAVRPR